jgi:hypothetical protein
MSKNGNEKGYLIGRDSRTGQMTTVREARSHPATHTVEHMPKPGYGDSVPKKLRGIVINK